MRGLAPLVLVVFGASALGDHSAPRSGYQYLSPETQALQNDNFSNPGMLWAEAGRKLWSEQEAGNSCQSCHGSASLTMRGSAVRYPRYVPSVGQVINLEQQINRCRTVHMHVHAWGYESQMLLSMETFIAFQSRGMPIEVKFGGQEQESMERGRLFFYRRRGQLNLACANCHEQNSGGRLHGEVISQGQTNGFPIYRQLWQTLGSAHRMFAWCNESVRAEPYPLGSQEYVDLEMYERWRSAGLRIESPAVRR